MNSQKRKATTSECPKEAKKEKQLKAKLIPEGELLQVRGGQGNNPNGQEVIIHEDIADF